MTLAEIAAETDAHATELEDAFRRLALLLFAIERALITRALSRAQTDTEVVQVLRAAVISYRSPNGLFRRQWEERFTQVLQESAAREARRALPVVSGPRPPAPLPSSAFRAIETQATELAANVAQLSATRVEAVARAVRQEIADRRTATPLVDARAVVVAAVGRAAIEIMRVIRVGREGGQSIKKVATVLTEQVHATEITRERAIRIARTETIGLVNLTEFERAAATGILREKRQVTQDDDRVRDSHDLNKRQGWIPIAQRYQNGLMYPGERPAPAEEVINCFVPGTLVRGSFVGGIRSEYSGPVRHIVTRSGNRLTLTVNHPVLTRGGLVAAKLLAAGDDLIAYRVVRDDQAVRTNIHDDDVPTCIQDVFESFRVGAPALLHHLAADDLHGDARFVNGQVHIVRADGLLELRHDAASREQSSDFPLVEELVRLSDHSSDRTIPERLGPVMAASASSPGLRELGAHGTGCALQAPPLDRLRFGLTPKLDAAIREAIRDRVPTESGFVTQLLDRVPSLIAVDEIIEVWDLYWEGHVYDLQSETGLMVANGILTSNCRCGQAFRA